MTSAKELAETALRILRVLKELPIHEKAAVLGIVGNLLQSEAKSIEVAQVEMRPPVPAVNDEHYRA